MKTTWLALALLILAGCSEPTPPPSPSDGGATPFDPVRFFTGHVRSWGVLENRAGAPTGWIETDCRGAPEGTDGIHMVQHLRFGDGRTQVRDWRLRRLGPGRYEATANDMVGIVRGEAAGRVFHWRWVLATKPGNALFNVDIEQWMYVMDGGAVVIRTAVRKLGVTLSQVTEQFAAVPPRPSNSG